MKRFMGTMLAVGLAFAMTACGAGGNNASTAPAGDASGEAATSQAGGGSETIKIAFIGNTTGDYQQYGIPVRNATALYFEQLNANGGINGKQIELLEYDDKGDGVEAINAYNLAVENGATAVVGSVLTAPTIALADETVEDNFPQITASGTAAGITVIDPADPESDIRANVFRSCFTDPYQGNKMAHYAKEKLNASKVAVFFETGNDYSEGVKDAFIATAEELGLEVVANEAYGTGDKDFTAQMTKIAAAAPDAVFMPIYYSEAGLAVKAGRAAGFEGVFMGGDGFGSIKDYATAEELEGTVYCSGYAPGTDDVKQFEADYKAKYNEDVPNMFAPLAYDAAMLMEQGIKAAEEKGLAQQTPEYYQAVIDGIKAVQGVKGVTGSYTFDENNDPVKEAAIIELKGGEEVFKEMF